jgi:hypothetical protein
MLGKISSEMVDVNISRHYTPGGEKLGYAIDCMFHTSPPWGFCSYKGTLEEIASEVRSESEKNGLKAPFYNISTNKGHLSPGFFEKLFGTKSEYTAKAGPDELKMLVDLLSRME